MGTFRAPDGSVVTVDDADAASAVAQGYKPMDAAQQYDQSAADAKAATGHSGVTGTINSALGGTLSGLTLGTSDAIIRALSTKATADRIAQDRANHPWAGGIGTAVGAIAPAILTDGASLGADGIGAASEGAQLLAHTPSGLLSRAGSSIADIGADSGAIGKALAGGAAGAVEGAGQAGGAYLSQSALEDKPLSAEGFVGAMGQGALYGGVGGSALSLGESTLIRAKSLFPRSEVTQAATNEAEDAAKTAITDSLDTGDALGLAAKRVLRENRVAQSASNLETAQKLNALKLSQAEASGSADLAAQKALAEAQAAQIAAKTEAAKSLAAVKVKQAEAVLAKQQALAARAARPTRKAFDLPVSTRRTIDEQLAAGAPEAESAAPAAAAAPVSTGNFDDLTKVADGGPLPAPSSPATARDAAPPAAGEPDPALMAQLQGTKSAIDSGSSLSTVSGGREAQQALEDAQDQVVSAVDPRHAQLVDATKELAASRKDLVEAWTANIKKGTARNAEERGYTTRYEDSFTGGPLKGTGPRRTDRIVEPTALESDAAASARQTAHNDYAAEPTLAERIAKGEIAPPKKILSEGETTQGDLQAYRRATPDEVMDVSHAQAADRGRELDESIRDALHKQSSAERPFTIRVKGKSVETGLSLVDQGAQREFEALGGSEAITAALRKRVGEHGSLAEDIGMMAPKISRYEKASANVADLIGPDAPPSAAAHAAQYRAAVEEQARQSAATSAATASDIQRATPPPSLGGASPAATRVADDALPPAGARGTKLSKEVGTSSAPAAKAAAKSGGIIQTAKDVGSLIETLNQFGIPGVPSLKDIPVVGPLLSMYLKARALSTIFRRLGGKTPATTEAIVASKAAVTRDRVQSAVARMLDVGAKAAGSARPVMTGTTALAYKLFDGKTMARTPGPEPKNDDQREYQDRLHELTASQQSNAIMDAVRAKVPTGDAALQQAIVDVTTRKLQFLNSKIPKPPLAPSLLPTGSTWNPTKPQLDQFSRYIQAADDPASVLEQLAHHGRVTVEGVEALQAVYPALYAQAQSALIKAAPDMQATLPYARRVSLSIMFGVPVDGTMTPSFVSFLRAGQPSAPQAPQGAAPPTPSISGAGVMTGTRTQTGLDRRSGA